MPTLKQLQEDFQNSLLTGDRAILSQIPDTRKEKKDARLGIYQYAYRARLMEFLENDYPQLWGYLGDEQFEALCMAYIEATPSHQPNARWYGDKLPAFIKNNAPWKELTQVCELALLEHELNNVFDEQDVPLLDMRQLASIAPDQWPSLVFTPVKATRRLDVTSNVTDIWNALACENEPPEVEMTDEPQHYLIYRDQNGPSSFRAMSYEEAMMWDKMAAGVPFGVLCELIATYGGEDEAAMRAAGFLQEWLSLGLVADFTKDNQTAEQ